MTGAGRKHRRELSGGVSTIARSVRMFGGLLLLPGVLFSGVGLFAERASGEDALAFELGLGLVVAGLLLLFAKRGVRFEPGRAEVLRYWGVLVTLRESGQRVAPDSWVVLSRAKRGTGRFRHGVFNVAIEGSGQSQQVADRHAYFEARRIAEAAGIALELGIRDVSKSDGQVREAGTLDRSLQERLIAGEPVGALPRVDGAALAEHTDAGVTTVELGQVGVTFRQLLVIYLVGAALGGGIYLIDVRWVSVVSGLFGAVLGFVILWECITRHTEQLLLGVDGLVVERRHRFGVRRHRMSFAELEEVGEIPESRGIVLIADSQAIRLAKRLTDDQRAWLLVRIKTFLAPPGETGGSAVGGEALETGQEGTPVVVDGAQAASDGSSGKEQHSGPGATSGELLRDDGVFSVRLQSKVADPDERGATSSYTLAVASKTPNYPGVHSRPGSDTQPLPLPYLPSIVLSRETFQDRLAKTLKISREHQLNDAEFDREVYVETDAPAQLVQAALGEGARDAIRKLITSGDVTVKLYGEAALVTKEVTGDEADRPPNAEHADVGLMLDIAGALPSVEVREPDGSFSHRADDAFGLVCVVSVPSILFGFFSSGKSRQLLSGDQWEIFLGLAQGWTVGMVALLLVMRGFSTSWRLYRQALLVSGVAVVIGGVPLTRAANAWFGPSSDGIRVSALVVDKRPGRRWYSSDSVKVELDSAPELNGRVWLDVDSDVFRRSVPNETRLAFRAREGTFGWHWADDLPEQ